jgi:hypothetical protein
MPISIARHVRKWHVNEWQVRESEVRECVLVYLNSTVFPLLPPSYILRDALSTFFFLFEMPVYYARAVRLMFHIPVYERRVGGGGVYIV